MTDEVVLLAEAIEKIAIAAGIIDGTQPMTGPQILLIAENCAQSMSDLQRDAGRYRFLREEDNWGEDSGDDCWEALGEANVNAFDAIVEARMDGEP